MYCILFLSVILSVTFEAKAQEVASDPTALETVRVLGTASKDELTRPNSAATIKKETVEAQHQIDATRLLKQVPGVYVQEEDGQGLRPNIGLRGTHPHRSRKIVLLEDSVLIGPAPYSAPAAYYTPFMNRIESIEVFKGVSSVPYGPNSVGGAVNYVTKSFRHQDHYEVEGQAGSFNFQKYRLFGNKLFGTDHKLLLESAFVKTDGFKEIDFGQTSGFKKTDIFLKGEHLLKNEGQHRLSWKVGYGDEDSDETYLGLALADFNRNAYRRYAGSQLDQMLWTHHQYQLKYQLQPTDRLGLWVTGYYHLFNRNWSRLNEFAGPGAPSLFDVLRNPDTPTNQLYYQTLTGATDSSGVDDLILANNKRNFTVQGLQLNAVQFLGAADESATVKGHLLKSSFRMHHDQIERRHTTTRTLVRSGHLDQAGQTEIPAATNTEQATALTTTLEDEVQFISSKLSLALRYEDIRYKATDDALNTTQTRGESLFVPGLGYFHQLDDRSSVFTGVNQGYTVVGPNDSESKKPEKSVNYEVGYRYLNEDIQTFFELIGFYSDYQNIKGTCSFSAGCNSNQLEAEFDGGKAKIYGLESRVSRGYAWGSVFFPISFNFTMTKAQFASESNSQNPEWGVGTIKSGDPLPYVPIANYSFNVGTEYKNYKQEVVFTWVGQMYDQAIEASREIIPAHGVVDFTSQYAFSKQSTLLARIDNVLDSEYLVSLRPFGARPGKARAFQLGYRYQF